MNELEKYAKNKSLDDDWWEAEKDNCETSFVKGFNIAIALDLPIKFAKYIRTVSTGSIGDEYLCKDLQKFHPEEKIFWSEEQLYQYWLNNIYKP